MIAGQSNVLNLCDAQLELDYHYLRAVRPFYSVFDISSRGGDGLSRVLADNTPAAKTIRQYWTTKSSGYSVRLVVVPIWNCELTKTKIDVVMAASHSRVDRNDLARKISDWELSGSF